MVTQSLQKFAVTDFPKHGTKQQSSILSAMAEDSGRFGAALDDTSTWTTAADEFNLFTKWWYRPQWKRVHCAL